MKKKLFVVYFNISLICVLLIGVELLGQSVFFLRKGYPLFESDQHKSRSPVQQTFELHPYLVGRLRRSTLTENARKAVRITSTDRHTRYTGAPADDGRLVRIAVLGGSTTFGTGVTDGDTWPALLQNALGEGHSVSNYGVPGYSTAEAIIQMGLIVQEKRPHVVVFYEGWNDIRNYHNSELGPDYFSHGMSQYTHLQTQPNVGQNHEPLIPRLAQFSALFRVTSMLAGTLRQPNQNQPEGKEVYRTPDPFVDRIYLRNLKTLRVLAHGMNAKVIFLPQVLNYKEYEGKTGSRPWTPHIVDDALPALLERFNDIMDRVCDSGEGNCLVLRDMRRENWQPADFVDDGHLSRSGGEKFSKVLAQAIRALMEGKATRFHGQAIASRAFAASHSQR